MWKAKITGVTKNNTNVELELKFYRTDNHEAGFTEVKKFTNRPNEFELQTMVYDRINGLQSVFDWADTLVIGSEVTPIDPKTLNNVKEIEYRNKLSELEKAKELVSLGVLTEEEAKITLLAQDVKTSFNATIATEIPEIKIVK